MTMDAGADLVARVMALLEERKAGQPVTLRLGEHSSIADWFVIASATSTTHARALVEHLAGALKREGHPARRIEGAQAGLWVLLDFGDVVVHIFEHDLRAHYDLEGLWGGEK